jgi:hypothetical protein
VHDPGACARDAAAPAALQIRVTDARGDVVCDAIVTARAGSTAIVLPPTGVSCTYAGLGDAPGTYDVAIEHAGCVSVTLESIAVPRVACPRTPTTLTLEVSLACVVDAGGEIAPGDAGAG